VSLNLLNTTISALALLVVAYVYAKPAVNHWAIRGYLVARATPNLLDLQTPEQRRCLPIQQRLRYWLRRARFRWYQRCAKRVDRVRAHLMHNALQPLLADTFGTVTTTDPPAHIKLTERERLIVHEAAGTIQHKTQRARERRLQRIHRGVRCAGGCGVRYGKRRSDHNFSGGGPLNGWTCPDLGVCDDEPTGDHHCGMCALEGSAGSADFGSPDPVPASDPSTEPG